MLDEKLEDYAKSGDYPFHMPGHKRRTISMANPYSIDITEIAGFDNLHQPQDLILEAMERMAKVYGAKKSYLLVGGSTCGNLAAFFAAVPQNATVIMGRNSHKSVYHAGWLRQAKMVYSLPTQNEAGFVEGTPLAEYERLLRENPDAAALVVTSPTYEGMMEPLDEIVALAHGCGIPVIVDAAHGAHLGFHPYFGKSPLDSGADAVIMSLHKTLPALTQTAVLHLSENSMILERDIENYLDVFETSSPSYVLMSSICQCIRFLENSEDAFSSYAARLQDFYASCKNLKNLRVKKRENQEPSKIVIEVPKQAEELKTTTGHDLEVLLREKYGLVLEMSSFSYGLAMTSVMDTEEGFARLQQALFEIDEDLSKGNFWQEDIKMFDKDLMDPVLPYHQAMAADKVVLPLSEAEGKIAAAQVAIYPPGIPLLVPGERVKKEAIDMLLRAKDQGLTINGLAGDDGLFVVN